MQGDPGSVGWYNVVGIGLSAQHTHQYPHIQPILCNTHVIAGSRIRLKGVGGGALTSGHDTAQFFLISSISILHDQ